MTIAYKLMVTAGVIFIMTASDANAQASIYYTGRANGANPHYGNGYGQNYYSNHANYGYQHHQYGNTGYLNTSYNDGNYWPQYSTPYYQNSGMNYNIRRGIFGNSRRYSSPSYFGQSYYYPSYQGQSYYLTTPDITVTPLTYSQAASSQLTPAMPMSSNLSQYATIKVMVPTMETQIWFEGVLMTATGMERSYQSTPLESGVSYYYTITARWINSNGKSIDQIRKVSIQAGQTSLVDFRSETVTSAPEQMIAK